MDPVHDRGSMDPVHESGPWTRSKVGGPWTPGPCFVLTQWALPLQAQGRVGSITSRQNCEACENLAIRTSQIGSVERQTFTFEQQSAQLDFIVQENEFFMWYDTITIIKVDQM